MAGKPDPSASPGLKQRLRARARELKHELFALYLAARDPRTPRRAKLLIGLVVAYAFSPIDLIPDFIPILGYLDDLILLPLSIAWAIRLIPAEVWDDCRNQAELRQSQKRPVSYLGAVVTIALWLLVAAWIAQWAWSVWR